MTDTEEKAGGRGTEPTAIAAAPHEKTMPLSLDGKPVTTLTTRPWTTLVTLGVSALCAASLWIVHLAGNHGTAVTTLDRLVEALEKGDVAALESDPDLGFGERAERDSRQRGLEEYNKILAAFQACETAGLERYGKIEQAVLLGGEEAFKKLPPDQQKSIRQSSKQEWLLRRGLEEVGKDAARGITDPTVLSDPSKAEPVLIPLGIAALQAKGETGLPTADEFASWKGKPSPLQKAAMERIREAGSKVIDGVAKDAMAAGQKLFKGLTPRERKIISTDSYNRWIMSEGIETLDEEDRALVTGPEMFLETADEDAEARRICTLVLPEHMKALIEGRAYEDFTSKREDYVKSTGREKYSRFLGVIFGSCDHRVESVVLSGDDPWDLFRISHARIRVDWQGCPGASEYLGEELVFRFDGHSWQFEPGAAAAGGGAP